VTGHWFWAALAQHRWTYVQVLLAAALTNVLAVLRQSGHGPETLVRMTWYVTDMAAYRTRQADIGAAYRDVVGRHFPTMSLIGVAALAEPRAKVEIECTAVLPD
jgi:enamine deaminase RidA (YjgF/YER057c/UK114 family)